MSDVKFFHTEGERNYVRAQVIWQILIGYVQFKQDISGKGKGLITYGDLADLMGYPDRRAGRTLQQPLGIIFRFCKANDLPYLNAIVVNEDTGIAGWEDMFADEKQHRAEHKRVLSHNWFMVRPPSAGTLKKYL